MMSKNYVNSNLGHMISIQGECVWRGGRGFAKWVTFANSLSHVSLGSRSCCSDLSTYSSHRNWVLLWYVAKEDRRGSEIIKEAKREKRAGGEKNPGSQKREEGCPTQCMVGLSFFLSFFFFCFIHYNDMQWKGANVLDLFILSVFFFSWWPLYLNYR